MENQTTNPVPSPNLEKKRPDIKVYKKDAEGKKIAESEIALWKNVSKDGTKEYYSGRDKDGNKYVAFDNAPQQ